MPTITLANLRNITNILKKKKMTIFKGNTLLTNFGYSTKILNYGVLIYHLLSKL